MSTTETPTEEPQTIGERGHQHGRPSSWALVAVVLAASLAAGAALIVHLWWLFWAGVGIVLAAVPAGKIIGIMDDTMSWGHPPPVERQSPTGGIPVRAHGQD